MPCQSVFLFVGAPVAAAELMKRHAHFPSPISCAKLVMLKSFLAKCLDDGGSVVPHVAQSLHDARVVSLH